MNYTTLQLTYVFLSFKTVGAGNDSSNTARYLKEFLDRF